MTNPKDELARVLEAAEAAAYARGWDDACAEMVRAASDAKRQFSPRVGPIKEILQNTSEAKPRRTGRPSSNTIEVVEECINTSPGKKGVDVVKAAQLIDPSIPERTVRTCLRRLKMNKKIWQRNGLWYPKPQRARPENDDEEATSSPPHH